MHWATSWRQRCLFSAAACSLVFPADFLLPQVVCNCLPVVCLVPCEILPLFIRQLASFVSCFLFHVSCGPTNGVFCFLVYRPAGCFRNLGGFLKNFKFFFWDLKRERCRPKIKSRVYCIALYRNLYPQHWTVAKLFPSTTEDILLSQGLFTWSGEAFHSVRL